MTDLEEEVLNSIGDQLAREIDKEIIDTIMMDTLVAKGWTATSINPAFSTNNILFPKDEWYALTAEWIHLNATGDYKLLIGQWVFENRGDAVMFTLKWS